MEANDFKDEVLRVFKTIREDIGSLSGKLDIHQEKTNDDLTNMKVELATLKMKLSFMAGFYGVLGGALPAIFLIIIHFVK